METPQQTRTESLDREECIRLLAYESFVGRVGFVHDGKPQILPVNYLAEEGSIVFCTAPGTLLAGLGDSAQVAFEVDSSRPLFHSGWSVVVHGTAHEVTDERELDLLRRGPLRSWAAPASGRWVRVSIDDISGRRIPGS